MGNSFDCPEIDPKKAYTGGERKFFCDPGVISIMVTLVFNIIAAAMYIAFFLFLKYCCSKSTAEDKAKQLKNRSQSFFVKADEEQEKMIIKDIFLDEGVAKAIRKELEQRKCSVA